MWNTWKRKLGIASMVLFGLACLVPNFSVQYVPAGPEANAIRDVNAFGLPYKSVYAAWGDFDNDGDLDVYVVNDGEPNNLYRNNLCSVEQPCRELQPFQTPQVTPSFTRVSTTDNPRAVILKDGVSNSRYAEWVDYDNDGDLDLYVVNDGMNRLFINNLFSPARPFDPFSGLTLSAQVAAASQERYQPNVAAYTADFSVNYTQTMQLEINNLADRNENMLMVYQRDLFQSGTQNPIVFPPLPVAAGQTTNNVFSDPTQTDSDNFITNQITPGMYLEIPVAAGVRRYVILEVLGPRQVRLDYEGTTQFQDIFRYRILRDAEFDLRDSDRFVNDFTLDGSPLNNRAFYNYSGFPVGSSQYQSFQLTSSYLSPGDQLRMNFSTGSTQAATLTTLLQVEPKSFGVFPTPVLGGQVLQSNFTFVPRRTGGTILTQKYFLDPNLSQFQLSSLQAGDQIEFMSGSNNKTVVNIASVASDGLIFLDSSPGSVEITPEALLTYEFIYRKVSTKTKRILTDRSQSFGASQAEIAGDLSAASTRNVKRGDHVILDPILDDPVSSLRGPPRNTAQPLGSKALFSNGQPRPGAVLEILEVLGANQLLVDAYPSEVGLPLNYQNAGFPYQIRHRYGRLKKDQAALTEPNFVLFDEFSPFAPTARNFQISLNMQIQVQNPINPYVILSNAGLGNNPIKLVFRNYTDSTATNNIRLLNAVAAATIDPLRLPSVNATEVPTLEYRPIYLGMGGLPRQTPNPPEFIDKRRVRLYGLNFAQLGVARGHQIAMLYRNPRTGNPNPQLVRRMVRIQGFTQEGDGGSSSVVAELDSDLEAGIYAEMEQLCTQAAVDACNPADPNLVNSFYQNPLNAISVEYEFLTTQAFANTGEPIELRMSNETTVRPVGFTLANLAMNLGDAIQFVPALNAGSNPAVTALTVTGFVQVVLANGSVDETASLTETILDVRDASIAPFNVDIAQGNFGIKPIYAGKLNELNNNFNQITISNPNLDLTLFARPGDTLTYFSVSSAGYLTPVTSVLLSSVSAKSLSLQRRLDLLVSTPANLIVTNPIYFRIARSTGSLEQRPAFRDERTELDFRQKLSLNSDSTVRGIVLLDVFKQSETITSPIFKRFKVKSLISRNVLELESIIPQEDNFSGYFYEIKRVERNPGNLIENNSGNGIRAQFADFNRDGIKDLYLLNQATNSSQPLLAENGVSLNNSVLLYGQRTTTGTTSTYSFVIPPQSPADQDSELKNRPGPTQDPALASLEFLPSVFAGASDFDGDKFSDLLILNRNYADRLFFTRAPEGINDARTIFLRSQAAPDSLLAGELFGLNAGAIFPQLQDARGAILADMNGDNSADIYYLTGDTRANVGQPVGRNVFFRKMADKYQPQPLFPNGALLDRVELGEARSGSAGDFNNDGYMDFMVLNKDSLFLIEPKLQGDSTVGEPSITEITGCVDLLTVDSARDLQMVDVNQDGFLDLYISRSTAFGATNVLCLASPTAASANQRYYAFELLPRDLNLRTDRQFSNSQILLEGTDTSGVFRKITRQVPYSWPYAQKVVIGAGSMLVASVSVQWPEGSEFSYGTFPALYSSPSVRSFVTLTQPSDFPLIVNRSGALSPAVTTVASKTTNTEGLGGRIVGSDREPVVFDALKVFLATNLLIQDEESLNAVLPSGTIKLYLDNSPGNSTSNYKNLQANGVYDGDSVDWLVATTTIKILDPAQLENYIRLLDVGGNVINPGGAGIATADFNLIEILADKTPSTTNTKVILNPRRDGAQADSVSFLMVYSVDKPKDAAVPSTVIVTFTPYLPSRKTYGFNGAIATSRWDLTLDITMSGLGSKLPYRAELSSAIGSPVATIFSHKGVSAQIDEIAPARPVISTEGLPASTRVAENLQIRGFAESNALIQVVNRTNGSTAIPVRSLNGQFVSILPLLAVGDNLIEIVAVDEYGNQSLPVSVSIVLDNIPPAIALPVVTNINIAKAQVSFSTPVEAALGAVVLRSNVTDECRGSAPASTGPIGCRADVALVAQSMGSPVIQCYESPTGLANQHSIPVGRSAALFGLQEGVGFNPLGLCPSTSYFVDIVAVDALGNQSYVTNAVAPFITLPLNPNPLDSDGDGIPDSVEIDPAFPDLDPYDANDALLDFDGDGINNIEEYKAGTNMYNPFDNRNLPIPNAGPDLVGNLALNPGVVELDASTSNLNGLTTREVSYFWRMVSVPNPLSVTAPFSPPIQNASQVKAWFSARTAGIYIVELVLVTDKQASTKPIQKRIEIRNLAPRVELETSLVGLVNQPVLLDGRRTTDPNGDVLSWRWVQSSGPSILLQKQSNPSLGLTSEFQSVSNLIVDRVGRYVFELIATDQGGLNSRQQTSILVSSQTEVFPLASAGSDLIVRAGEYFSLRGEGSRAKTVGASLIYLWEPIVDSSSTLLPQKCRNQSYAVFSQNEESVRELVKAKPKIRIPNPGLYAFSLRVSELGRGLESNPDCVQVQVLPVNRNISQPNPQVFSQPIRVQASASNLNLSLAKVLESGGGKYKTPVNHTVTIDATESYIAPLAPLISISEGAEATIRSTSNCLHGSGPYPYHWTQSMGEAVVLKPLRTDCSQVSFAPVNVGVYAFDLVLHSRVDGVIYPSLPRSTIVVVNDNFNEIPTSTVSSGISSVENNFVPYIVAPQASVGVAGSYTINPSCVDEDLQTISNKTTFGEWNYSQADLRTCSSLNLSCRFTQMEGPPIQISGVSCSPEVNFSTGSYRFLIQAFDGAHYSIPVDWYVSVPGPNQAVPQANAGVSRTVNLGNQAALNGSLSISTVRDFEYLWRQRDGFPVVLNQATTVNPTFEPLATGQYVFDLRISEPNGLISLPSEVTVIVQPSVGTVGDTGTSGTITSAQKALEEGGGGGGGGCFVATAASGSSHSWLVVSLSQFRDQVLMAYPWGISLVKTYYEYSPFLAEMVAHSPVFRVMMLLLLLPLAAIWQFGFQLLSILGLLALARLVIQK